MPDITELRKEQAELVEKCRHIHNLAEEQKRSLTDEEKLAWHDSMTRIATLDEQLEREEVLAAREATLAQSAGTVAARSDLTVEERGNEGVNAGSRGFPSFGEFLLAVARAYTPGATLDPRLVGTAEGRAEGLGETLPSEGGFLVQTDFQAGLVQRIHETGLLVPRVRNIPISAGANGVKINAVAETSRADGSRLGGVLGYWLSEAGTKAATKPEFRQMELVLKKLIGMCYATDELLADAAALEAIIMDAFAEEFGFLLDKAIFEGTGAGQPLGVMSSPCLVSVAAETNQTAATILYDNIVNMWARMWGRSWRNAIWLINQDVLPQLHRMVLAVGTGGVPVYLPAGGVSGSPYGQLYGRPVIPIEQCATLGTTGDILLGDFSQYVTITKGGIQTASSIHVSFVTDETVFRFVYRTDGQPVWNSPMTPHKGSNTQSPFVVLDTR